MSKSIALHAVALIFATPVAWTEVVLDGSMGRVGAVPQNGSDYAVTHNLGQIRGTNLYHSFSQFNIRSGESATFSGPGGLANVLSRVTGGNASNIDGLLRSTVPGANFWFVNPSGVFFGPGASIDVPGSFYAGTADYIGFADGSRFDATNPATTTLTAAAPTGFGFLGAEPAPLQVTGSDLSVSEGSELALVGGDVRVGGGAALNAPEGSVRLEGAGSAGEVGPSDQVIAIGDVSGGSTVAISDSEVAGQTLVIRGGSIETVGETKLEVSTSRAGHGSRVAVLAQGDIDLGESTWVRANGVNGGEARIESKTGTTSLHGSLEARGESGSGGHVELLGVNVGLFGGSLVDVSGERGGGIALIGGDYQGLGPIRTAARTYVGADALIRADAWSQGDGGRVIVWGDERAGFDGRISARGGNVWGDGGFAEVSSRGLLAFQGSVDLGAVNGAVGELLLDPQSIEISNADNDVTPTSPFEPVPPGPSTLNVSTLVNALETADVTVATSDSGPDPSDPGDINLTAPIDYDGIGGDGRTLTLRAHNDVNIDASITDQDISTDSDFINLVLEGDSDNAVSGDVNIRAEIQTNGGDISATGQGISIVESTLVTDSVDGAGDVGLLADRVIVLDNAAIESDAVDTGVAGFITIDAGDSISLSESTLSTVSFALGGDPDEPPGLIELLAPRIDLIDSNIEATSFGDGVAGFVEFRDADVVMLQNTLIRSDAEGEGEAGLIAIEANESINLRGSELSTASFAFDGDPDKPPGVIELGASEIELFDATIEATSTGGAGAGDVILNADRTVKLENSVVLSEAKTLGEGGFISIAAGESISQNGGTISTAVNDSEVEGGLLGEIKLLAPKIELANATIASTSSGTADAGDVTLGGDAVTVTAGSDISSDSFGTNVDSDAGEVAGSAGTVFIVGVDGEGDSQAVNVSLVQSTIRSDAKTDGQGGVIFINASGSITQDGGTISTTVNNKNVENGDGDGDGDGQQPGVIELGASEIELVDANIEATSTGGAGAGDVILNADRTVKLENSVVLSEAKTVGEGGFISIAAGESISQNGGTISTAVNGSDVEGGLLGAIALVAPDIELFDATIEATSTGTADAGDVTLGGDTVTVSWSRITSSSLGTTKGEGALAGLAGTVFVVGSRGDDNSIARRLRVTGNSVLETNGQLTGGGDIELRVTDRVEFEDSRVTANATGDGGNITITGQPNVVVLRSSHINANSKVGNGGIIEIKADVFLATPDSTVTARTEDKRQLEGVVDIDAAGADVVGGLAQLPANFQDPGRLLLTPCGERVGTAGSRIEVSPPAGLPQSPEEYFFSSTSPVQYPYGDDSPTRDQTAADSGSQSVYMLAMSPCAQRHRIN